MDTGNQMEKKQLIIQASQDLRYRKVLSTVVQSPPRAIIVDEWDAKGDLTFSILMTDLGLTYKDYNEYEDEIFSYFVINFIGELLVRDNLDVFVEKLRKYNIQDYMSVMEEYGSCKNFGVKTHNARLIFKFHVSFLKDLLTENLRESLGNSKE